MTELFVWAPHARRVEVEVEVEADLEPAGAGEHGAGPLRRERRPLQSAERGYFSLPAPALPAGARYLLRLDAGEGLPDPRSAYQPDGVHGPSQVWDHDAFVWTDQDFTPVPLAQAVVYELHVGTFTSEGTFAAAIVRLDHLVELGVSHVQLMPVATFPGRHGWGYDGVALFAPHPAYGTPDDLKRLVDACHARGLAALLDVVYNHLGPDGNYLGRFGPYFTREYATPWGAAVNLDGSGSDEVRRYFCDNALYWLDRYHFDGLRLDAVHALLDRSALPFLEQLGREVRELGSRSGRPKVLIAESDSNDPRLVRPVEDGGLGLDAQWSDDFHHCLHALLTGERRGYYSDFGQLRDLASALRAGFVYAGRYSQYRGRSHGRPLGELPLRRLLGYLQNHDQVGNRPLGDRIGRSLSVEQVELAAALVLTGPFVPLLFQGEEWNASSPFQYFTDHQDSALARAVRAGRQREFAERGALPDSVPDPQAAATFQASKLDWGELVVPERRRVLEWYRALLCLRRSEPAFCGAHLGGTELGGTEPPQVDIDEAGSRWLTLRSGALLVAANFSAGELAVPGVQGGELLLGSPGAEQRGDELGLPAWGVGILRRPA